MKNALILNGTRKEDAEINAIYSNIINVLESNNWNVNSNLLREKKVAPCQGCFDCWLKTPGECKIHDEGRDIAKYMVQSDLIIHLTEITFGGYSSEMKKVMDRFIPNILPFFKKIKGEVHHKQRYEKRASIIVMGFLTEPDKEQEAVFKELIYRNSINMLAPIHEVLIFVKGQAMDFIIKNFNDILNQIEVLIENS